MDFMMGICHVLTVLNFGEVIAEGSPLQIRNDPSVLKAYLGDGRTNRAAERPSTRTMVGPTPGSAAQPTLAVRDVVAGYAAGSVLHSVSFDAVAGEVRALVGANGAGKSTAMLTVSGVVRRTSGTISLGGERIDGSSPAAIVRRGVAHVPEGRRVLSGLSVDDNLAMGAYTVKDRRSVRGQLDRVFELLPVLAQRRRQLAGSMSGGEQQMLAIARALMCQPTVLLLDEPTMGLSPLMADRVLELVRSLADGGLAVILVEQNATAALDVSDRAYVMRMGRIVAEGSASDLMAQDTIRNAYLGSD
jgi:branched-chain amino acid transport system ATP-binding protein